MFGELISAGAGLLGGLFGKSSQEKANRQNIEFQKKFAQKGIQWRAADARAAGIHPLAALGANTASFSPSIVGDTSMGSAIGQAGQDLGRAINSTRTSDQKLSALQTQLLEEQIKGVRLDNGSKAISNTALASSLVRGSQTGPNFPSVDGRTNTGMAGQNSNYIVGGQRIVSNPNFSDAQVIEDRHGDVAAAGYGLVTIPADAYATAMKSPNFRQALREVQSFTPARNRAATAFAESYLPRRDPNYHTARHGPPWATNKYRY